MMSRFHISAIITANTRRLTANMRSASRSVNAFAERGERMVARLNAALQKTSVIARRVGLALGAGAFAGVFAGRELATLAARFKRAIGAGAARFGVDKKSPIYAELTKTARDIGKNTEFTATGAAEALGFLATAGFDVRAAIGSLPSIVNYATANTIELARAADIASDAIGALGLDSNDPAVKVKNLARTMDLMTKTALSANLDQEMLFEAVKAGAPAMKILGAEVEDVAATFGILASSGIKGSNAGVIFKNTMLSLAGIGNQSKDILEELGVDPTKNGKFRDMADILGDIGAKLSKMTETQRAPLLEGLFGKLTLSGQIGLLSNLENFKKMRAKIIAEQTGSTDALAATIRDDLQGSLDSMGSAWEGLQLSFFETKAGPVRSFIDGITASLANLTNMIDNNPTAFVEVLDQLVDVGKALLTVFGFLIAYNVLLKISMIALNLVILTVRATWFALRVSMMAVVAVMMILRGAIFAANAAMAAMRIIVLALNIAFALNPVGLVVAGIVILIGLAALLIANWEPVSAWFSSLWDSMKSGFGAVMEYMKPFFDFIDENLNRIKKGIDSFRQLAARLGKFIGLDQSTVDALRGADTPKNVGKNLLNTVSPLNGLPDYLRRRQDSEPFGAPPLQTRAESGAVMERKESSSETFVTLRNETGFKMEASKGATRRLRLENTDGLR